MTRNQWGIEIRQSSTDQALEESVTCKTKLHSFVSSANEINDIQQEKNKNLSLLFSLTMLLNVFDSAYTKVADVDVFQLVDPRLPFRDFIVAYQLNGSDLVA